MARPKSEATLRMLDWAALQDEPFTVRDLFDVYVRSGGNPSSYSSFHTLVGHMTAKPWKDDQEKYKVSEKRPFAYAHRGSAGKGAHLLVWALGRPLREPPSADDEGEEFESPEAQAIENALDKLEDAMGSVALKQSLQKWRSAKSLHDAVQDIQKNVPARLRAHALHIAADMLMQRGKADEDDVEAAEDEITAPQPAAEPEPAADPDTVPDLTADLDDFADEDPTDPDAAVPTGEPEPEEEPEEEPEDEPEPAKPPPPPTPTQAKATPFQPARRSPVRFPPPNPTRRGSDDDEDDGAPKKSQLMRLWKKKPR